MMRQLLQGIGRVRLAIGLGIAGLIGIGAATIAQPTSEPASNAPAMAASRHGLVAFQSDAQLRAFLSRVGERRRAAMEAMPPPPPPPPPAPAMTMAAPNADMAGRSAAQPSITNTQEAN